MRIRGCQSVHILSASLVFGLLSCSGGNPAGPDQEEAPDETFEYKKVITEHYLDLDAIWRISRFRSVVGHDYSDESESCRSMKHYFEPFDSLDWTSLGVRAPARFPV